MNPIELRKHISWLQHEDIRAYLESDEVLSPWFPAYSRAKRPEERLTWFSAIIPSVLIPELVKRSGGWDIHIGDGRPATWTSRSGGVEKLDYSPLGNEDGIEPLVVYRTFHGMRSGFAELAQEFRLYYNLYPEPSRQRFLIFDDNGDESEAARYGDDFLHIRTDLLLRFCDVKQMALAIYVEGFRDSKRTLKELGLAETHTHHDGSTYDYFIDLLERDSALEKNFRTSCRIVGKKYVLPGPPPPADHDTPERYQDFIIDKDPSGNLVRHTCDPDMLANYFGKNPRAPHYFTPVFFRAEVLGKYYADPQKYSVEDGHLHCGSLWGLRMDNDQTDIVVVFLGDLGRDLSEAERNYWFSFNIPPQGRTISQTAFKRGFLAEFVNPMKPDLVLKHEYNDFNGAFGEANGWYFFLPLHEDDEHFFTGLRLLSKDNQSEFDSQLIALTKLLVDSLNDKEITKGLTTLVQNDKGITKLEKFFAESGAVDYEAHIKFLRVLQDLRSKSAAHRKGTSYEKLIVDLQMPDEGQQKVFAALLTAACEFIRFLRSSLIPKASS